MPSRVQALLGKTVALFVDHKFEDMEVMYPKLRLEEEGATVLIVGIHAAGTTFTGKFGIPIRSSICVDDVADSQDWAALVLPGGFAPDYMRRSQKMLSLTVEMAAAGKPVAAICHGPWMLCSARRADGTPLCTGHKATAFVGNAHTSLPVNASQHCTERSLLSSLADSDQGRRHQCRC